MTHRMLVLFAVLAALLLPLACGSKSDGGGGEAPAGGQAEAAAGEEAGGKPADAEADFSSPEAAARTFFRACADKDEDLLSRCFSPDAPGEFGAIVEKKVDEKMLGELASMFQDASVVSSEKDGEGEARVKVKLPNFRRGEETLRMVEKDGAWKILDF